MTPESFKARNHALKPLSSLGNALWYYKIFGKVRIWDILPYSWQRCWYDKIVPVFKPQNKRLRKVIPKIWTDISSLIETVNFEFVKKFYEEEYVDGVVDWEQSGEDHVKFARWLEETYRYITVHRPRLEKELDAAYPPLRSVDDMFEESDKLYKGKKTFKLKEREGTYEELYGEVNRIEQLIVDLDTEVLTEIIKRRQYFWT
jgi:hypothetical protein